MRCPYCSPIEWAVIKDWKVEKIEEVKEKPYVAKKLESFVGSVKFPHWFHIWNSEKIKDGRPITPSTIENLQDDAKNTYSYLVGNEPHYYSKQELNTFLEDTLFRRKASEILGINNLDSYDYEIAKINYMRGK